MARSSTPQKPQLSIFFLQPTDGSGISKILLDERSQSLF